MSTREAHDATAAHDIAPAPRLTVVDSSPADADPESPAPPAVMAARGVPQRTAPGTLLAVCGLCGGAGVSTLSYLIASYALRWHGRQVIVCDTGGPGGGLAACARVSTPRSLTEIAEIAEVGAPLGQVFATTADGLRVLAATPRLTEAYPEAGVQAVLDDAREAHALTVVDCGTLAREADRHVLRQATHAAWMLPATRAGIARAQPVLAVLTASPFARQLVIARRDQRESRATLRALRTLALERGAPLILVPHLPDVFDSAIAAVLEAAQVPLQAIVGALDR